MNLRPLSVAVFLHYFSSASVTWGWTTALSTSPLVVPSLNDGSHRISSLERQYTKRIRLQARDRSFDEDSDDDEIVLDEEEDWRSFRAKLVMSEKPTETEAAQDAAPALMEDDLDGIGALFADDSTKASVSEMENMMTPLDPSSWAYDSGKVIEQGAVILGGVEQDFGFGLRQQYFHKTAILIVEHEESTFTKAIILNRPTDIMLDDDLNPGTKWRVWFGGDVQGLDTLNPSILCLHSLKTEQAVDASVPVMKDIQWTSFDSAKKLVKAGHAKPSDFWTFAGYAGWAPGQLMGELERKSWYMVATDSQTLLKELARLSEGADPRDAGLDTWELLMNMIGRGETAKKNKGNFDDLMLKEWAREHLLSEETGGGAKATKKALKDLASGTIDRLLGRAEPEKESVSEGTLIRASSADRSPFLLERQELHKSIVLIILENEAASIGVVLSRPASAAVKLQIAKEPDGEKRSVELPLRFGGQYSVKGNDSLLWLHCNAAMRQAKIGSPFEAKPDGIWKCTADDMIEGISKNLASPEDFMVVSGVSLWTKGSQKSLSNEIEDGTFEIVPDEQVEDVWDMLVEQTKLSTENLEENLDFAEEAWAAGASSKSLKSSRQDDKSPLSGLGEGFDEEDDSLVFKSDVRVADLSDDALRNWIATFLLDEPIR